VFGTGVAFLPFPAAEVPFEPSCCPPTPRSKANPLAYGGDEPLALLRLPACACLSVTKAWQASLLLLFLLPLNMPTEDSGRASL